MKYFRYILLPLFLLLFGCAKEGTPDTDAEARGITLALNIPAAETNLTRAADATPLPGETLISNVYVLFYPKKGGIAALPAYFYQETGLNLTGDYLHNFPVADLRESLTEGASYDIYVLASLPPATQAPSWNTGRGDLLSLAEKQFARSATAPGISFSGKGEVVYNSTTGHALSIPLRRTVARLDITLTGLQSGQTAELLLVQPSATPYLQGGSLADADFQSTVLTAVAPDAAASFYRAYVYKNYPAVTDRGTELRLTVKNDDGSAVVVYQPVRINNGSVERNKIYEVTVNMN